ncbi:MULTISPECIES: hypothetical protein [unclassified Streptomyces]|uniref:hypothetical protein n=1 Tax=unclassified Streptomyces TaxID=2593676 RepID=UPI002E330763|nr:hypothetical protein [Streptomyces sp. NBC_01356]WTB39282.1 hypothetical protein OG569_15445 [Streptomyces sp. NBC_00827]
MSENPTPGPAAPASSPPPVLRERVLDLVALLALLAVDGVLFVLAGPEAFAAVTTSGVALFATWRARRE